MVEPLEDRTLLSVTTLLINNGLSVVSDADDDLGVSVDVFGNVVVDVNGQPQTMSPPVVAATVESITVVGGDLSNTIDLSGVNAAGFSFQDIDGNPVTIHADGRNGDDTLIGSFDLAATILGGDGDDTLSLLGSTADHLVDGGNGDDSVSGGDGAETLAGGDGHDTLSGGLGDDLITGDDGTDVVTGGDGQDSINGGDGPDLLDGGDGDDDINGESGRDTVIGGDGNDTLRGGGGNDELYGDTTDPLVISTGNDLVQGQGEDDTIIGGGGADVLQGGPGADLIRSTASDAQPPPPPQPPQPPQPPAPPPLPGFPDAVDSGGGTDSGTTHDMTNGPGDASLTITVNETGLFGTASGVSGDAGAIYDPVGPAPPAATTTFESELYFRDNTADPTGTRGLLGSLASNISTIRGLPTEANSTFTIGGLSFALTQAVTPMIDNSGVQTGSLLTQTLRFSNTGAAAIDFEFVRYIDGDLNFDGTLIDGGGRTVTGANEEVLFETDQGGSGTTDTTFVGITGKHGTEPASNRYEIDSFIGLQQRIAAGTALDDLISGDSDGDEFVDPGSEYDITLGLRNTFSLAPGGQDLWTTHTIFGSGAPSDVGAAGPSIPPVAVDDVGTTRANNRVVIDVVSNDSDPDGELDYSSVVIDSQPTNGIAYSTSDGLVSYFPNANFVGIDTFTYTVADFNGDVSSPATVTVTVTPPDLGDTLNGNAGNDTIVASDGNDRLFGGSGGDSLNGAIGNDSINGQSGRDSLVGGTGADRLNGGTGDDNLNTAGGASFLSIDNARLDPEGDSGTSNLIFTVTLSKVVETVVTVDYFTVDGTAVAGLDFVATSETLSFLPGETSRTIVVQILGDLLDESDEENFLVSLANPVNVAILDGQGDGRIIDDDPTIPILPRLFGVPSDGTDSIVEFDTLTGAEINRFPAPGTVLQPDGVTFNGTNIFYMNSQTATLFELNPDTGAVIDSDAVTTGSGSLDGIGFLNGFVYIMDYGDDDIHEFDPVTDTVVRTLDIDGNNSGVSIIGGLDVITGPDRLVATQSFGVQIHEIDPVTALVTSSFAPGTPAVGSYLGVAVVEQEIFVGSTGATGVIDIFDRSGTLLRTLNLPTGVNALGAFGGAVTIIPTPPPPPPAPFAPLVVLDDRDTLLGGAGNDTLLAGEGADQLSGGSGNDHVTGGSGIDHLLGGAGDDTLLGSADDDTLDGQGGVDVLNGGSGDDTLVWYHGAGSDLIDGGDDFNTLEVRDRSDGNSFVVQENSLDLAYSTDARMQISDGTHLVNVEFTISDVVFLTGGGDDTITLTDVSHVPNLLLDINGQSGNDTIDATGVDPGVIQLLFDGDTGNDTILGSLVADVILGGDGDDELYGGGGRDSLYGGDGDDRLEGQDDDDLLHGELGFDTLDGGPGNDLLYGHDDNDLLLGRSGDDTLHGDAGRDTVNGNSGDDRVLGGDDHDKLFGGSGDDFLDGGRDNDSLNGNSGNDRLQGNHGDDWLQGSRGDDTVLGGDGHDRLFGDRGDDTLVGGDGNDTLNGARGDDILLGGDGDDVLLAGSGRDVALGEMGNDFVKGQGGTLDTVAGGEGLDRLFDLEVEINEAFELPETLIAALDEI